jgi:hypothetical protein
MTKFAEPNYPAIFTENQESLRPFDRDMVTVLGNSSQNLKALLDQGLSFLDNIDCRFVTFTSDVVAGAEFTVAHTLGKTPTGYFPVIKDKPADLYNTTSPDKTNLYLKCSVASATIKLLVF